MGYVVSGQEVFIVGDIDVFLFGVLILNHVGSGLTKFHLESEHGFYLRLQSLEGFRLLPKSLRFAGLLELDCKACATRGSSEGVRFLHDVKLNSYNMNLSQPF